MSSASMQNRVPRLLDRSTPAAPQLAPATPGRRAASALVDGALVGLTGGVGSVLIVTGLLNDRTALVLIGGALAFVCLVGLVVCGVVLARKGVSPGKRLTELRLASRQTGEAPGFGAAWGRFLLAGIGGALVVGFVVAVVQILRNTGGERRTWYDSMTKVMLVQSETGGKSPASTDSSELNTQPGVQAFESVPIFMAPPGYDQKLWIDPAHDLAYQPPEAPYEADPPVPLAPGADARLIELPAWAPTTLASPAPSPVGQPGQAPVRHFGPPPSATPAQIAAFLGTVPPAPPAPPGSRPAVPLPVRPRVAAGAPAGVSAQAAHVATSASELDRPFAPRASGVTHSRVVLTFDTGLVMEVSGTGVMGRNPQPLSAGGGVVRIVDRTRTVSQSHLAFEVNEFGMVITDLSSTNGSAIIGTDGARKQLAAQDPVQVHYGASVALGECLFVVTRSE